jgi:hypothetical protein
MTRRPRRRQPGQAVSPACGLLTVALAALVWAAPAAAQVYKCVDKAGRTTYQQQPCPDAQKGARMDLPLNNGSVQDDATDRDWAAKAGRKEVGVGMPRAFVVQAYGTPQEMRPGRAEENAAEVWRYRRKDFDLALGFNRGVVAWTKDNPVDEVAVAPDPEPSRRQGFHVARKCAELEGDAGAATAVSEEMDEGLARRVMRHVWEPEPGDRERTTVTCADGVVVRVERLPMR